jgi:hypothetical protein
MSRLIGREPYSLNDNAADIWIRNRDRLLTLWRDPAGPPPGASGFSPESLRGAGRTGVPCWSELKFEGGKLPKLDKNWPEDIKKVWRTLKDG